MLRTWVINIALFAFLFGISFNSFTQSDSTSYSKNYVRVWPAINQISLEYERRMSPKHSVVLSSGYTYPFSKIVDHWFFEPAIHFKGIVSRAGWKRNFNIKNQHGFGLTVNALHKYLTHDRMSINRSGGNSESAIWEERAEIRNVYAVQCLVGYTLNKRYFTLEVFEGASIKYIVSNLTVYNTSTGRGDIIGIHDPPKQRTEKQPSIGVNAGIKIGFGW